MNAGLLAGSYNRVLALLAFFLLLSCTQPATPTITPLPTSTPLPPELQALVDEREALVAEINHMLGLYQREGYDLEQLDRGLRMLVPTLEALSAELEEAGVELSPALVPPTPPVLAEAASFDVGMVTEDGVRLWATYYRPGAVAAPGVVLLHMLDGQRGQWEALARQLHQAGFGVLAIDLRGHGESEGGRDFANMDKDAAIAAAYLRHREEIDSARIALVGASIGANIALSYAAADPQVRGVALLSPGEDYQGITTADALARFGDRPLLIAASREDSYTAQSAQALNAAAAGPHELIMLDGQGHGTNMLGRQNGLEQAILVWLQQVLGQVQ